MAAVVAYADDAQIVARARPRSCRHEVDLLPPPVDARKVDRAARVHLLEDGEQGRGCPVEAAVDARELERPGLPGEIDVRDRARFAAAAGDDQDQKSGKRDHAPTHARRIFSGWGLPVTATVSARPLKRPWTTMPG